MTVTVSLQALINLVVVLFLGGVSVGLAFPFLVGAVHGHGPAGQGILSAALAVLGLSVATVFARRHLSGLVNTR